jgi:hypothetical protein
MELDVLANAVGDFGFPIVAAVNLGYSIYSTWKWATQTVKPVLDEATTSLIVLIDHIRILDNDMIRLTQKLNTVLALRGQP